jgi:3-methyladenine DNA glycosylase AlkC
MADETKTYPELKHIFDRARLEKFAGDTKAVWAGFDSERFLAVASNDLDALGIMQRMRQVAQAWDATLPGDYAKALDILRDVAPRIEHGFASISLAEFVVLRGLGDFDRSMDALAFFTRFGSAEFAVRPFILADRNRALTVMRGWADDGNEHVRRLASEGARPRLPWSFQLKELQADPELAWPMLDRLKADPSLYVRKSVANHLNDMSKDHPDWLTARLAHWDQSTPETAWIVKQALRTLVKKGDTQALALVGASGKAEVRVDGLSVAPARVKLGDRITISASVTSAANTLQKIVADYAIHYVKSGGKTSRKVFKLKTFDLAPGETIELAISQAIRDFSTRKHFAGWHRVELMLNGEAAGEGGFEVAH